MRDFGAEPLGKVKLLYIVPSLDDGGAQRFTIHFLKHLNKSKFNITLLLLRAEGELTHLIPNDIVVIKCHNKRTVFSVFRIVREVWRQRPNIVFTTLGHLNLIVSIVRLLFPRKTQVVARETNYISLRNRDERYPKLFDFLFRTSYRCLDHIICQSKSMELDLKNSYGLPSHKLTVVYNPVDIDYINGQTNNVKRDAEKVTFLSVGRLAHQKGYDRILRALKSVNTFDFEYLIVGQGPLRDDIEAQVKALGLENNVKLIGYTQNPYEYMTKADCLLLGSRYEGLPNVVLEAYACGTPVIAFDAPGGMNEIIYPGITGWLVADDDIDGYSELIRSRIYLDLDKEAIIQIAQSGFNVKKIMREYEALLETMLYDRVR